MSPHSLFSSIRLVLGRKPAAAGKPAGAKAAHAAPHKGHPSKKGKGQMRDASPHRPAKAEQRPRGRNWPLLALAVLGALLAGYLTATSWMNARLLYCEAGSPCDIVQNSHWSTLLGAPVAFWGLLAYAALALIALRKRHPEQQWGIAWLVALPAAAFSVYLTAISVLVLHAACKYCLASLGLLLAIVALLAWQAPRGKDGVRWGAWLLQSGGVAAALVLVLHLHYAGVFDASAGPEDPYLRDLAIHLTQSGAKFYGASWCPHCQNQKAMFGGSAGRLPYVECSPNGQSAPSAPVCVAQGVTTYPTWDVDGERATGELRPEDLARRSHFQPAAK